MKKIESILLLILRLLYIEKRKQLSQIDDVIIIADEIYDKYTEKQAGRMSESFSRDLSSVKETAERHTRKMFLISMIPSAALILLELIRYILSAVSAI